MLDLPPSSRSGERPTSNAIRKPTSPGRSIKFECLRKQPSLLVLRNGEGTPPCHPLFQVGVWGGRNFWDLGVLDNYGELAIAFLISTCLCYLDANRHHPFAHVLNHPRAPALRWLWKEEAIEVVLEFLESTRVECRASTGMARARVGEDRGEGATRGAEGEEGGPGPP